MAGQLRSSADLEKLDGYEFHVRIPLQELLRLWRRRIEVALLLGVDMCVLPPLPQDVVKG